MQNKNALRLPNPKAKKQFREENKTTIKFIFHELLLLFAKSTYCIFRSFGIYVPFTSFVFFDFLFQSPARLSFYEHFAAEIRLALLKLSNLTCEAVWSAMTLSSAQSNMRIHCVICFCDSFVN